MTTITPATLAAELAAATPSLNDEQQQLALGLYRLLADGQPVEQDRLATRTGLEPQHVTELLGELPGVYLDDSDRVIGFWGLTIRPMTHRLLVDGRVLYAWCAWDTLFLPELIGKLAQVQSTCPTTSTAISLTVHGRKVTNVAPDSTVLSFLHRDQPFDADAIADLLPLRPLLRRSRRGRAVDKRTRRDVRDLTRRRHRDRTARERRKVLHDRTRRVRLTRSHVGARSWGGEPTRSGAARVHARRPGDRRAVVSGSGGPTAGSAGRSGPR